MGTLSTSFFGLTLGNVPFINIRLDFNALLALFRNERFRRQFTGFRGKQIPIIRRSAEWGRCGRRGSS